MSDVEQVAAMGPKLRRGELFDVWRRLMPRAGWECSSVFQKVYGLVDV